ncbi:MAG: magnesium transporter MgtE, partial [Blastopirellula sp. JB062]
MQHATPVERRLNDPVSEHMRTDAARLVISQKIGDALVSIREKPPEGRIIYFYVVDEDNCLKGVVPTRRLLLNDPEKTVGDIMIRNVITIPETATVL